MLMLLQLQKLPGKGDGGWKKVSLRLLLFFFSFFVFFFADQKIVSSWKNDFGAIYNTSNKLLLVARHILTTGLQKCF